MRDTAYRIVVGSPIGARSGVWRFWSTPDSDAYCACREMRGEFKISLHQSGECNAGFTKEYERDLLQPYGAWQGSRHLEQWTIDRPVTKPTIGCRILVPTSELRQMPLSPKQTPPDFWISVGDVDETIRVDVVLAPPATNFLREHPAREIITHWSLENGDVVWIGVSRYSSSESITKAIVDYRGAEQIKVDRREDWNSERHDGRLLVVGVNEKGYASFIDAAWSSSA